MKIHFVGATCSTEEYGRCIIKDEDKTAQASVKYFRILCEGISRAKKEICVYSQRPTTKKKSGRLYIKAKNEEVDGVCYHYCRLINLKFIKNLYVLLAAFFWFVLPRNCQKGDVVLVDPLTVSLSQGTIIACKLRKIPVIAYITDVPTIYAYNREGKISIQQRISYQTSQMVNGYILLTKAMNKVVNSKNKPYLIMEGFVDDTMQKRSIELKDKYKKFVCMYTGGVEQIYGLDMLVEGFLEADIEDSELHIYGAGQFVNKVKELSKLDSRIKYMGTKPNEIVVVEQMKATLLINPRYTKAEYTKYSFPSKNLEYLVSGTPTLTTLLPGMPHEYREYVFLIKEETSNGLATIIRDIEKKNRKDLYQWGERAKQWVLTKKGNTAQACVIIKFLEEQVLKDEDNNKKIK